jgi:hypothetical protein
MKLSFILSLALTASLLVGCSDSDSPDINDEIAQPDGSTPSDDTQQDELPAAYVAIMTDQLIEADYWQEEPAILAAGLGFTDINGIPDLGTPGQTLDAMEQLVREYGGGWHDVTSTADDIAQRARTSSNSVFGMTETFGYASPSGDGLPMELSHPVLASTVQREDILIWLNTGDTVVPTNISVMPNMEFNERSTLVMNGDFGNRLDTDDPEAVFPVMFEIVDELLMMTPAGAFDAKGLAYGDGATPLTAYRSGHGPRLCAAKLTRADAGIAGEGAPTTFQDSSLPNDAISLYGEDADFRIRVLTTGGFSPDGVRSLYPSEYRQFFRVGIQPDGIAADDYDALLWLTETDTLYSLDNVGSIEVLGLAELGVKRDSYDDSYIEDHDNQIDIVLKGDRAMAERVVVVHIPATGDYQPFYNPGGPGDRPDPDTRYSEPGPTYFQPVTIAIDNPMLVSYEPD